MRRVLFTFAIAALLAAPLPGRCQTRPRQADLEQAYDAFIRRTLAAFPEIPGAEIVVVSGDKPIFMRAYGLSNKESGTRATTDTLFYIASSTKSFMGLAASLLDREGAIRFDDPVTKYTPGIAFKTDIPAEVTVRDLLTHTSGLHNPALPFRMAYSGEIDDRALNRVLADGTTYAPADHGKYTYTNLGYNIYGMMLRLSLRQRWQDVLQQRIFSPLKMQRTSAFISKPVLSHYPMAEGYLFDPEANAVVRSPLVKNDNSMQSAGGIVTTAKDLSRWLRVNINGGMLDGKQIFPADVMTAVRTGYTEMRRDEPPFAGAAKYGIGWMIGKYHDREIVMHNGGYPGWSSHISFMPGEKIGVAVLINESTAGGHVGDILAAYAYDRLLGTDKIDDRYAGYLNDMAERYGKIKRFMVAAAADRAKRSSQLSRPVESYEGQYDNAVWGHIFIAVERGTLAVRMGNIHVLSTPYKERDSIRVEMVPGQGEVIKFELDESGRVTALTYNGVRFEKI
jgi:CubicO group peptidase (beta-lactamase class C family)